MDNDELRSKTNYRNFFESAPSEINSVMPADEWIRRNVVDEECGFRPERPFVRMRRRLALLTLKLCEEFLGIRLSVKSESSDFPPLEHRYLEIIKSLQDEDVISRYSRLQMKPDAPKVIAYFFKINVRTGADLSSSEEISMGCRGSGSDSNAALAAGLAEVLERHSHYSFNGKNDILGSFADISEKNAVDLALFESFSDRQLSNPEVRKVHFYDDKTLFVWHKTASLLSSGERLVPLQLVSRNYNRHAKEPLIRQLTTSGAGAGASFEQATHSALCECIERDAFFVFWLNKIAPPKIDLNTIKNAEIRKIIDEYERYSLELHILNIATDVSVPAFLIVSVDRGGKGPAVVIGSAADLDHEAALLRALRECSMGYGVSAIYYRDNLERVNNSYPYLETGIDRAVWWSQKKAIPDIEWFLKGEVRPLNFPYSFKGAGYKEKYDELKSNFKSLDQEAYLVETTSPLAKKHGITCVYSLIPGFYPLYLDERHKYLGIRRLYELPVRLGYLKKPRDEKDLNQIPHPMT